MEDEFRYPKSALDKLNAQHKELLEKAEALEKENERLKEYKNHIYDYVQATGNTGAKFLGFWQASQSNPRKTKGCEVTDHPKLKEIRKIVDTISNGIDEITIGIDEFTVKLKRYNRSSYYGSFLVDSMRDIPILLDALEVALKAFDDISHKNMDPGGVAFGAIQLAEEAKKQINQILSSENGGRDEHRNN